MSWISRALLGSPLTYQRPFSHSRSATETSSIVAAIRSRLVAHLARDDRDRGAGDRRRAAAVGAEAVRGLCRCRRGDLDVLGGMPSSSATICANVVSWPWPWVCTLMRRRPCRSGAPAGRSRRSSEAEDVHVLARAGADALGEERDADAHQLAAGALLGLLAAQLVVAGDVASPRASSRRSCPSRTSSRSCSYGNCSGWMKLFIRSSIGSTFISCARRRPSARRGRRPR
jgi:hypothetical protein